MTCSVENFMDVILSDSEESLFFNWYQILHFLFDCAQS